MRIWNCRCRNRIYFDNSTCLACGSELGFCPACRSIVALDPLGDGTYRCNRAVCQARLTKCYNYFHFDVCNRCIALDDSGNTVTGENLCDCCRFNDTIPDLSMPGNLSKWYRLEAAKRRLFYELDLLGLPYGNASDGIEPALAFDFKADLLPEAGQSNRRGDWRKSSEAEKVYTGHASGRITINLREADDVEREAARVKMGEAQRSLIGHFRHEIGHFYWDVLVKDRPRQEAESIAIFGDHNHPTYAEALKTYYQTGAPADWPQHSISAYATMHPWEDFAETWATYLDMISMLDTASHQRALIATTSVPLNLLESPIEDLIDRYRQLGLALNEFNRAQGLLDAVPELFVPPVIKKLGFIHQIVAVGRTENPIFMAATQAAARS